MAAFYMRNRLAAANGEKLRWLPDSGFFGPCRQILGQGLFVSMAYLISPLALVMLIFFIFPQERADVRLSDLPEGPAG